MNNQSFQAGERIENPDLLFGRNKKGQLLEQLFNLVKNGTNFQLQGERRSGKTSLLKCLENKILQEKINIVPIFIDFKEVSIKGNANMYRYILAKSIALCTENNILKSNIIIRGVNIKPIIYWEKLYEKFQKIGNVSMQEVMKDFFIKISSEKKLTFFLLIDEYEWLFLHTIETEGGFYPLRSLSQEPTKNGIKPFSFAIAGAKSWEKFAKEIGSPELNSISVGIKSVSPLDFEDFTEMWQYCLENIQIPANSIILNTKEMFNLSGGIPFYAKVIGETLLNNSQTNIDFNILLPYFENIFQNLDAVELNKVKGIIENQNLSDIFIFKLADRGILAEINGKYYVNGTLFKEYLVQKFQKNFIDERQLELFEKGKTIELLIKEINDNSKNKKNEYIFTTTNETPLYYQSIKELSLEFDIFKGFNASLYKILFEHTKRNSTALEKLPADFGNKNIHLIIKIIDSLRQNFGGHDTSNPTYQTSRNQLSKPDLLQELLNSKSEPSGNDFYKIQKETLERFTNYLQNLRNFVRDNATW